MIAPTKQAIRIENSRELPVRAGKSGFVSGISKTGYAEKVACAR